MTDNQTAERRYAAFISYSHRDDAFARKLQRALESYRLPAGVQGGVRDALGQRLGKVFRDREDFAAGGELKEEIQAAIRESPTLVVICSPSSATSTYVNSEVEYFQSLGRGARIVPVLLDGEPTESFPQSLRNGAELLAADARTGKDGFRLAVLKVISGILQVGLDELIRREDAARMRRATAAGAMALFAIALIGIAFTQFTARQAALALAVQERELAAKERVAAQRSAEAEQLARRATNQLGLVSLLQRASASDAARDYTSALRYALLGLETESITDNQRRTFEDIAARAAFHLEFIKFSIACWGPCRLGALSSSVGAVASDDQTYVFRLDNGALVQSLGLIPHELALTESGNVIAVASPNRVRLYSGAGYDAQQDISAPGLYPHSITFSADQSSLWIQRHIDPDRLAVELVSLRSQRPIQNYTLQGSTDDEVDFCNRTACWAPLTGEYVARVRSDDTALMLQSVRHVPTQVDTAISGDFYYAFRTANAREPFLVNPLADDRFTVLGFTAGQSRTVRDDRGLINMHELPTVFSADGAYLIESSLGPNVSLRVRSLSVGSSIEWPYAGVPLATSAGARQILAHQDEVADLIRAPLTCPVWRAGSGVLNARITWGGGILYTYQRGVGLRGFDPTRCTEVAPPVAPPPEATIAVVDRGGQWVAAMLPNGSGWIQRRDATRARIITLPPGVRGVTSYAPNYFCFFDPEQDRCLMRDAETGLAPESGAALDTRRVFNAAVVDGVATFFVNRSDRSVQAAGVRTVVVDDQLTGLLALVDARGDVRFQNGRAIYESVESIRAAACGRWLVGARRMFAQAELHEIFPSTLLLIAPPSAYAIERAARATHSSGFG